MAESSEKQESLALKDEHIVKVLTICHNMGLDTKGLKAQILEMEDKGKDIALIRQYLDAIAQQAYSGLQKQKAIFERKKAAAAASSSSQSQGNKANTNNNNKTQDPRQVGNEDLSQTEGMVPYFKMIPSIQAYEILQLHLFILFHLLKASRDPTKRETHPYWFNRVGLEDFLNEGSDIYTMDIPDFQKLREAKTQFYRKQLEGGKDLTQVWGDAWMDEVTDQSLISNFRDSRTNVRNAMIDQMLFLNTYRFIEILTPSIYLRDDMSGMSKDESKLEEEKKKDEIKLLKKGWVFLEWYQHVAEQRDQRGCMAFFLQLALNKELTW